MNKIAKAIYILLFVILVGISSLVVLRPYFVAAAGSQSLLSPLPNFLTLFSNNEVETLNLWLPKLTQPVNSTVKKPQIDGKSAILYDLTTKEVLYSKNPNERLPMASLTKIMTAIIALENQRKDNKYLVKPEDLVGEDSMGLSTGEVMPLSGLLYGLVLHSGNDAAETLAKVPIQRAEPGL